MNKKHPKDIKTIFNRNWRINHIYKIVDKHRQLITFKRNEIQKQFAKDRTLRDLILKARQHGMTTNECIESLDDVLFKSNFTAVIVAHKKEDCQKIFRKVKLAFENIPSEIKLHDGRIWKKAKAKFDNKNEYYFPETNSRIYVATEIRGDTVNRLHVSEAAFINNAEAKMAGMLEAVPEGGIITIESTANGAGGWFFDTCQEAQDKANEFKLHFFGWQDNPDYSLPVPDDFVLTKEEKEVMERLSTTLKQMVWRRKKKQRQKGLFEQEYPATPEEAFLYSGRPVFNKVKISDWVLFPPKPENEVFDLFKKKNIFLSNFVRRALEGNFKVFIPPQKGESYVIGSDISEGIMVEVNVSGKENDGSDYTVIDVLDRKYRQVAQWRGKIPYDRVHEVIIAIGKFYNYAYIGCERNNHGLTVVSNLAKSNYPQYLQYTEQVLDEKTQKKRKRWGWSTNKATRSIMLDELAGLIEDEGIKIFSSQTQKECLRFIYNDNGKMEAQEGYHDDCVISLAIACQMIIRTVGMNFKNMKKMSVADLGF